MVKLFSNFPSDVLLCLPHFSFNIEHCQGISGKFTCSSQDAAIKL